MYNYDARLYDLAIAQFIMPDSIIPDTYNPQALNRYAYCLNNPLKYTDPTGHWFESAWDFGSLMLGVNSFLNNVSSGSFKSAAVDFAGMTVDTVALALPVVAGGAGVGIKAWRAGKNSTKLIKGFSKAVGEAHNAANTAKYNKHLKQLEKYGFEGTKELQNGKIRYYGNVTPANKSGEMAGRLFVREWDPSTGNQRTWMETIDHNGNVRIVRPETGGTKTHYMFDKNGNFTGTF